MRECADWSGRTFLDLGCGTGFHLPRWHEARAVIGVEPHADLLAVAGRRTRRMDQVTLRQGAAQAIPLPDASVDVAHARWAYFFGPGCEPGLRELSRVVRRGGTAFVIDNDPSRSTFGAWFRRGYPKIDAASVERFWAAQGWHRRQLDIGWSFERREDFEAVVRIEFDPANAERIIASHVGTEVDYAVNLWWRHF